MDLKRNLYNILSLRLSEIVPLIQIISGPRQVGKSTAIKQVIANYPEESIYVSLDQPGVNGLETIRFYWENARTNAKIKLLVFDEIQNVPGWGSLIKFLFDEDRNKGKFNVVILGSSSLALGLTGDESLLGRFEIIRAPHWSYLETNELVKQLSKNGYSITHFLQFGGYPILSSISGSNLQSDFIRRQEFIKDSILEPVLSKDILSFSKVLNTALLRQTLQLALSLPCEEISFNKIIGQLSGKGNAGTVKTYLELLEKAFLIKLLYRFTDGQLSIRTSSPKIIPSCPALVHAFSNPSKIETDPVWFGHIFEMAIINKFLEKNVEVFYWKEGNLDVDCVIRINNELLALEIKSGTAPDWRGLKAFKNKYPRAKIAFIGRELGEKIIKEDDPFKLI